MDDQTFNDLYGDNGETGGVTGALGSIFGTASSAYKAFNDATNKPDPQQPAAAPAPKSNTMLYIIGGVVALVVLVLFLKK